MPVFMPILGFEFCTYWRRQEDRRGYKNIKHKHKRGRRR